MGQYFLTKNKKAQAWSLDVSVAIVIFITGIIILYIYAINYTEQSNKDLNYLLYEGNTASELILNEGELGIISKGKINQTKLDNFYYSDYEDIRNKLKIRDNFYFLMDDLEINGTQINYVGNKNTTSIDSLIKIDRFTIYKNKPVKFQLFIWK